MRRFTTGVLDYQTQRELAAGRLRQDPTLDEWAGWDVLADLIEMVENPYTLQLARIINEGMA